MILRERILRRLRYLRHGTLCALCASSPLRVKFSRYQAVTECDKFTRERSGKACYVFVEEERESCWTCARATDDSQVHECMTCLKIRFDGLRPRQVLTNYVKEEE